MSNVLHLEREEGAAAGGFRDLREHFVAAQNQAAVVGGDGVDDDFGALRHFDGLRAGEFALVILAVTHHHDCLARRMIRAILQKFIFAGAVDGVVKRRASTILKFVHASGKQLNVVGKVLRHLTLSVEADYESFIEASPDRVLQEAGSGILLKIKTTVHRSAHIDEQTEVHRQIRFPAEVENGLRRLVIVEYGEIILPEVADELAVLVGSDEQNVYFVNALMNGEQARLRIVSARSTVIGAETGRAGDLGGRLGQKRCGASQGESR